MRPARRTSSARWRPRPRPTSRSRSRSTSSPTSASGRSATLWRPALTKPGDSVTLRAEVDAIVVLSACPQDIVGDQRMPAGAAGARAAGIGSAPCSRTRRLARRGACAAAVTFDVDSDSILHLETADGHRRLGAQSWLRYDQVAVPRIVELFCQSRAAPDVLRPLVVRGALPRGRGDDRRRRPRGRGPRLPPRARPHARAGARAGAHPPLGRHPRARRGPRPRGGAARSTRSRTGPRSTSPKRATRTTPGSWATTCHTS